MTSLLPSEQHFLNCSQDSRLTMYIYIYVTYRYQKSSTCTWSVSHPAFWRILSLQNSVQNICIIEYYGLSFRHSHLHTCVKTPGINQVWEFKSDTTKRSKPSKTTNVSRKSLNHLHIPTPKLPSDACPAVGALPQSPWCWYPTIQFLDFPKLQGKAKCETLCTQFIQSLICSRWPNY